MSGGDTSWVLICSALFLLMTPGLLRTPIISVVVVAAGATAGILYVLKAVVGLRTSPEAEALGIDLVEHAEAAYAHEGGEGFLSRQ